MKIQLALLTIILTVNANAQNMKDYKIDITIDAPKHKVWNVITDFKNYPSWNSVLTMDNNDSLLLGKNFQVTIIQPNGKKSQFKAKAMDKEILQSFSATQTIVGKWFFTATHLFTIEEIDDEHTRFIQEWKLKGVLAALFRKQIFKELVVFNNMNQELKELVEE